MQRVHSYRLGKVAMNGWDIAEEHHIDTRTWMKTDISSDCNGSRSSTTAAGNVTLRVGSPNHDT